MNERDSDECFSFSSLFIPSFFCYKEYKSKFGLSDTEYSGITLWRDCLEHNRIEISVFDLWHIHISVTAVFWHPEEP